MTKRVPDEALPLPIVADEARDFVDLFEPSALWLLGFFLLIYVLICLYQRFIRALGGLDE